MMVAAFSETASIDPQNPKTSSQDETPQNSRRRPPLFPSERDNAIGPKTPKPRHVSSRYMSSSPSITTPSSVSSSSSSTSRRCSSPLVSRNSRTPMSNNPAPVPKPSVSADRRLAVTPDLGSKLGNAGEVSAATKLLITSTRSLSVSFQGEAFSLPISKTKVGPQTPNLSNVRKSMPLKSSMVDGGGDQVENSKPIDKHRWPARTRQSNALLRSLDCTDDKKKLNGSENFIRALHKSMIYEPRRASFDGRMSIDLGNSELLKRIQQDPDNNSASDSESVCSNSTSVVQECGGVSRGRSGPRGIVVPARFWQETNSRLRRLHDPGSPLSTITGSKKSIHSKKFSSESPLSTPIRGAIRPGSPSRGMGSPSRVKNSVSGNIARNFGETPSVLSYAVDVRRGKAGENRVVDAHFLRLLYNRHLQWRFVNARTEAGLVVQKHGAENNIWNAWITISNLRDTVTKKRHRLQLLRQKLKLASMLMGQMTCLEGWASLDEDHSLSLHGAIEALKASTLRLPIVGGAIADIQNMKGAISSAVDVMQAILSSICSHLSKAEEVTYLVTEIAKLTANERALLEHCKDSLSIFAILQVKECSLRTHRMQYARV